MELMDIVFGMMIIKYVDYKFVKMHQKLVK